MSKQAKSSARPVFCEKCRRPLLGFTACLGRKSQVVLGYNLCFNCVRAYCEEAKAAKTNLLGSKLQWLEEKGVLTETKAVHYNLLEAHREVEREEKQEALSKHAKEYIWEKTKRRKAREKALFELEFKRKYARGFGSYTWTDGRGYDGEWRDGMPHGSGHMYFPDGTKYDGDFEFGLQHGEGTSVWTDGCAYKGQYKNGKEEGVGEKTWPDGTKYQGEWKEGKQNGHGKQTWPDGTEYEGDFNQTEDRHPHAIMIQNAFRRMLARKLAAYMRLPRGCPKSLMHLCLHAVAKGVSAQPQDFPAKLIMNVVPVHQKAPLGRALLQGVDGLSDKFRAVIPSIAWTNNLDYLEYTQSRLTEMDIKMLSYFLKSSELINKLFLQWNALKVPGARCIAEFVRSNRTLTELDLSWNCMQFEGAEVLAKAFQRNSLLKRVNLAGNNFRPRGCAALAQWVGGNCNAVDLDMSFNEMGVPGTAAFCEALKTNRTITSLNLRFNEIGPNGGAMLVDALRLNDGVLKNLVVSDNHLGKKQAAALARQAKGGTKQRLRMLGYPRSVNNQPIKLVKGDYILNANREENEPSLEELEFKIFPNRIPLATRMKAKAKTRTLAELGADDED